MGFNVGNIRAAAAEANRQAHAAEAAKKKYIADLAADIFAQKVSGVSYSGQYQDEEIREVAKLSIALAEVFGEEMGLIKREEKSDAVEKGSGEGEAEGGQPIRGGPGTGE